jgi:predicted Zn-dependent protease
VVRPAATDARALLEIGERLLAFAEAEGATGAEVVAIQSDTALTRFANSEIHQNVAEASVHVSLRFVLGGRQGVASSDRMDESALHRLAASAAAIARVSAEREDGVALPGPAPAPAVGGALAIATAEATPELRADGARAVIAAADAAGVTAYGSFKTEVETLAVVNSRGVRAAGSRSDAHLLTVMMGPGGGTGYAEQAAVDVAEIDASAVGGEAAERARLTRDAIEVPAGDYPVVLESYAVGDITDMLGYLGFSALAVEEGRSFAEPGRRIGSDLVTIWDDGADPAGLPMPFDYEGVPKERVVLVDRGVCRDVVYDAQTAARAGRRSTGHGLPAPNTWGPFPLNMFMAPGTATRDELIGGMERGLVVTRFHYTNPVHPKLAIVTGMTRDGTFLVEGGRIVAPVRNLRYTQSYLDALAGVEAVSAERRLVKGMLGGALVPAVRISGWTFTGTTRH